MGKPWSLWSAGKPLQTAPASPASPTALLAWLRFQPLASTHLPAFLWTGQLEGSLPWSLNALQPGQPPGHAHPQAGQVREPLGFCRLRGLGHGVPHLGLQGRSAAPTSGEAPFLAWAGAGRGL